MLIIKLNIMAPGALLYEGVSLCSAQTSPDDQARLPPPRTLCHQPSGLRRDLPEEGVHRQRTRPAAAVLLSARGAGSSRRQEHSSVIRRVIHAVARPGPPRAHWRDGCRT